MARFCVNCGREVTTSDGVCPDCSVSEGKKAINKRKFPVWAIVLIVLFGVVIVPITILVLCVIFGINYLDSNIINIDDSIKNIISRRGTVGDTLTDGDVKITFVDATIYDEIATIKPNDGNLFVVLFFNVKNVSDDSRYISVHNFDGMVYGNEVYDKNVLVNVDGYDSLGSFVLPDDDVNGYIVYEVPKDWRLFEVSYRENSFDKESIVFSLYNENVDDISL